MKHYPLFKIHVDVDSALPEMRKVLESGFINEGLQVTELTEHMSRILEAERLCLVNSCTSALTLALRLSGVVPGTDSEVITTAMTCVASNTPILNLGGKVVWADIDPKTAMISPADVEKKITAKTKAVICVAWAGTPCELESLRAICRKKGVKLIQDAAHAFGARYQGKPISQFADYTCYSFQAIKHVTSGDGGALVCESAEDFAEAKKLKWFGIDRDGSKDAQGNWKGQHWDVDVPVAGYKFNLNNLSAALGLSQIKHVPKILNGHRANAAVYDREFEGNPDVTPLRRPAGAESSFWVYTVLLNHRGSKRDEVLAKLNAEGIGAGLVHVPNDDYGCFKSARTELPGVREFSSRQVSLPVGWWVTPDEVQGIARRLKTLLADVRA
jgi:dTDP-4-amino-4,6-dideoxygalactose transaminase